LRFSAKGARGFDFALKNRLERRYGKRHLHFITCSCHRRRASLGAARERDVFLKILEGVRTRYQFLLVGYVVMPEGVIRSGLQVQTLRPASPDLGAEDRHSVHGDASVETARFESAAKKETE
jgi:hypothetical protein